VALIEVLSRNLPGGTGQYHEEPQIFDGPAEIQTGNFPNTSEQLLLEPTCSIVINLFVVTKVSNLQPFEFESCMVTTLLEARIIKGQYSRGWNAIPMFVSELENKSQLKCGI
jgi:hypothetical protein